MQELKDLQMSALLEMLAKYTDEYLKMQREGGNEEEQRKCKRAIGQIMAEMEFRKRKKPDLQHKEKKQGSS